MLLCRQAIGLLPQSGLRIDFINFSHYFSDAPEGESGRPTSSATSSHARSENVSSQRRSHMKRNRLILVATSIASLLLLAPAFAQKRAEDEPVFREYRGVQIGMTAEEARKKLGTPKTKG